MTHAIVDREQDDDVKRRRHPVRIAILTLVSVVVIAALVAGAYVFSMARSFDGKAEKTADAFPSVRCARKSRRPTRTP